MSVFSGPLTISPEESDEGARFMVLRYEGQKLAAPLPMLVRMARVILDLDATMGTSAEVAHEKPSEAPETPPSEPEDTAPR